MRLTEEEYVALMAKRRQPEQPVSKPATKTGSGGESKLERRFSQQLQEAGLQHVRNYFFLPDRDFELDFAFPEARLAVEIQGMAHRIKANFKRDIEKRALAMLAGWRVLELDGDAVRSGLGIQWLRTLLGRHE